MNDNVHPLPLMISTQIAERFADAVERMRGIAEHHVPCVHCAAMLREDAELLEDLIVKPTLARP